MMDRLNQIISNTEFIARLNKLSVLENDRIFCKHDINHFLDVARLMTIYANQLKIDLSHDIIYATALLHDLGRVDQYQKNIPHEIASANIAKTILVNCGFNSFEIEIITKAILMHRNPIATDDLGKLLYLADKKSRMCFCCNSESECNWSADEKNQYLEF